MIPASYRDKNVCIIGLGYVGLTLAVAMADCGLRVHGVEINSKVLDALKQKKAHFSERGLNAKLAAHLASGRFTFGDKLLPNDRITVYIVTVGTPVGDDKRARFEAIHGVCEQIAGVLKDDDLVILRSTVRVGTTREIVKPLLDRTGRSYDLAFCPERTLEGKALVELGSLPQIVGGIDNNATFRASQLFSFMTPSVVRVRDTETAEMAKLINNTQRDFLFAFANEVASMCEVAGISAHEVISAGNIGYPRANLPMPGPCLEKDPYILAEGIERFGFAPQLALSARRWNEQLPIKSVSRISRLWRARAKGGVLPGKIAVLGLAFKGRPETDDLRGSLALPIIEALRGEFAGVKIDGWDAVVPQADIESLGIHPVASVEDAFAGADIVIIQNNHECFAQLPYSSLLPLMRKPGLLYDFWNTYTENFVGPVDGVYCTGLGEQVVGADVVTAMNRRVGEKPGLAVVTAAAAG
ncbi:nucleotide sugar dehydrogenase [Hyphomicrobium sp.]|uniref:nucleotide sugar dehydrogenase n=1 Tax=Hyphomicrobium sp. TaxID=82 RepID=UPI000FA50FEC|nr:nucleotide sugar dehydrogenase [Hyphomicrobium sp.]RUO98470.1 MAG: nucleotide sugar dehydrogenase [Hyphomicrobium sp.]